MCECVLTCDVNCPCPCHGTNRATGTTPATLLVRGSACDYSEGTLAAGYEWVPFRGGGHAATD